MPELSAPLLEKSTRSLSDYQEAFEASAQLPGNCKYGHRPYYEFFDVTPGSRILDVGSYLGANLVHYAKKGCDVTGVEVAKFYVDRCQKHLKENAVRAKVHHGLIEEFEDPAGFDHILCTEILMHCVDPDAVVDRVLDLLRPGGSAFFAEPENRGKTHVRQLFLPDLRDLLLDAGFEDCSLGNAHGRNYAIGW